MVLVRKLSGLTDKLHVAQHNPLHYSNQNCCGNMSAGRDNLRRGGRREVWIDITLTPSTNRMVTREPLTCLITLHYDFRLFISQFVCTVSFQDYRCS